METTCPLNPLLLTHVPTDRPKWIFPGRGCSLLLNRQEVRDNLPSRAALTSVLFSDLVPLSSCEGHVACILSCWSWGQSCWSRLLISHAARARPSPVIGALLYTSAVQRSLPRRCLLRATYTGCPCSSALARAPILLTSGNDYSLGRGQDSAPELCRRRGLSAALALAARRFRSSIDSWTAVRLASGVDESAGMYASTTSLRHELISNFSQTYQQGNTLGGVCTDGCLGFQTFCSIET